MKLIINLDEEYINTVDKIKFLVGGRTDRKMQLEIIKAIKNGVPLEQEPTPTDFHANDIPTITITIEEYMKLRECEDKCKAGVEPKANWISVKDRLPRANEYKNSIAKYYLVQNEYGDMMVARWNGIGWEQMYQYGYVEDKIVAWQELPQLFKEAEE